MRLYLTWRSAEESHSWFFGEGEGFSRRWEGEERRHRWEWGIDSLEVGFAILTSFLVPSLSLSRPPSVSAGLEWKGGHVEYKADWRFPPTSWSIGMISGGNVTVRSEPSTHPFIPRSTPSTSAYHHSCMEECWTFTHRSKLCNDFTFAVIIKILQCSLHFRKISPWGVLEKISPWASGYEAQVNGSSWLSRRLLVAKNMNPKLLNVIKLSNSITSNHLSDRGLDQKRTPFWSQCNQASQHDQHLVSLTIQPIFHWKSWCLSQLTRVQPCTKLPSTFIWESLGDNYALERLDHTISIWVASLSINFLARETSTSSN